MGKITYGQSLIIMVTCSIPFLIGTLNGSVTGVDPVDDSNDVLGYRITGIIVPPNATMNTCCQSPTPLFNRTTGEFLLEGLKDGEYILAFSAPGYEAIVRTIPVNGSDVDLGVIFLQSKDGQKSPSYRADLGPWRDAKGNGIPGINVSLHIDMNLYWNLTGMGGIASLEIPIQSIPNGTNISCTFHSGNINWRWNQEAAPYGAFASQDDGSAGSNVLIYSISAMIAMVFFFLVWSVMQIIRKRGA